MLQEFSVIFGFYKNVFSSDNRVTENHIFISSIHLESKIIYKVIKFLLKILFRGFFFLFNMLEKKRLLKYLITITTYLQTVSLYILLKFLFLRCKSRGKYAISNWLISNCPLLTSYLPTYSS